LTRRSNHAVIISLTLRPQPTPYKLLKLNPPSTFRIWPVE
jgi:hypothetical protein